MDLIQNGTKPSARSSDIHSVHYVNDLWISYRSLVYNQKGTASSALFPMTMGCVALSNAVMYDRLTFEREGKINSSQRLNQGTRIALFPKFVGVVLFPMFVGTPSVGRLLSWGWKLNSARSSQKWKENRKG